MGMDTTWPTMAITMSPASRMPMGMHCDLMNLKYSFSPLAPFTSKPEVTKAERMYTTHNSSTKP